MTERTQAAALIDQALRRDPDALVEISVSSDRVGPTEMATFIAKMRDQFQKVMAYIDETGVEDASILSRDMNDAFGTLADLVSKAPETDDEFAL